MINHKSLNTSILTWKDMISTLMSVNKISSSLYGVICCCLFLNLLIHSIHDSPMNFRTILTMGLIQGMPMPICPVAPLGGKKAPKPCVPAAYSFKAFSQAVPMGKLAQAYPGLAQLSVKGFKMKNWYYISSHDKLLHTNSKLKKTLGKNARPGGSTEI